MQDETLSLGGRSQATVPNGNWASKKEAKNHRDSSIMEVVEDNERDDTMHEEYPEITASRISSKTAIWVALIGLIGVVIGAVIMAVIGPLVQKQLNQPDSVTPSTALFIEQFPQLIFAFSGSDEGLGGNAFFRLVYDDNEKPVYKLIYDLPLDQSGYGGVAFQFDKGQNVSEFQSIDFTIQFNKKNDVIDLYLVDISDARAHVRVINTGIKERNLSIPLSNFNDIDLKAIKEISFNSDTSFVTGYHETLISNIRFIR